MLLKWELPREIGGGWIEKPLADKFWEKVQKTETCWLWLGATQQGYGFISNAYGTHLPCVEDGRATMQNLPSRACGTMATQENRKNTGSSETKEKEK